MWWSRSVAVAFPPYLKTGAETSRAGKTTCSAPHTSPRCAVVATGPESPADARSPRSPPQPVPYPQWTRLENWPSDSSSFGSTSSTASAAWAGVSLAPRPLSFISRVLETVIAAVPAAPAKRPLPKSAATSPMLIRISFRLDSFLQSSSEELVWCYGKVADVNARGVVDGVGDGGGRAYDADLTDAFRPHRVDVRVFFVDPGDVDLAHVGVGRDVVFGEVVVDHVSEPLVYQALLVQRHTETHRHPADELRTGGLGVDDLPDGEDAGHARDAHLSGIRVYARLGEVSTERAHRVVLGLGVVGRSRLHCVAFGRVLAVTPAEKAGRLEDGRTPDRDARGAASDGGRRQVGIPDPQLDRPDADAEGVGGDLGQRRPRSRADVHGPDLNGVAPFAQRADPDPRTRHPEDRIHACGHPGTHEQSPRLAGARRKVPAVPPEALRSFAEAGDEVAAGIGEPRLRVDLGFVADTELDGVEVAPHGHLVHRRFESVHPWGFAGSPHPRRHIDVQGGEAVSGAAVLGGVHRPRRGGGLLGELLDLRALLDDVVGGRREAAVFVGP